MIGLMTPETKAETLLLEKANSGEVANCKPLSNSDKQIRPDFIRALMLGRAGAAAAGEPILPMGAVRLSGAKFDSKLDLSHLGSASAQLPALCLEACSVDGEIDLTDSTIGEVELQKCDLLTLRAPRARIKGQLILLGLTLAKGADIDLDDVDVANSLAIEVSTSLKNQQVDDGQPLTPCAAGVGRLGQISLCRASVGGQLDIKNVCCGKDNKAIVADHIDVAGDLILTKLDACGTVRSIGARIGGQLVIAGGMLAVNSSGGEALNAESANISGGVELKVGTTAVGEVSFAAAEIAGPIAIIGGNLRGLPEGVALNLQDTSVRELLFAMARAIAVVCPPKLTVLCLPSV